MLNLQLRVSDGLWSSMPSHSFSLVPPRSAWNSCLLDMKLHKVSSLQTKTKTKPCQTTLTYSTKSGDKKTRRRTSSYHPTIWDHQLIESIRSPYDGVEFDTRIEKLKHEVKQLLKKTEEPLARLELIDSIRRLGLSYHFDEEIGAALARFCVVDGLKFLHGLNETALCFRLLREHGHCVSSDVFNKFREGEKFMTCLSQDVKGLLSLYEATHLALPEEEILEEAKEFSLKHLQCLSTESNINDSNLVEKVKHSLEAPLYWLMPRLEARHFIDVYEREEGKSSYLLDLAKLDFNVVQALHQKEIKELSRWWKDLGLVDKVDFSRDRIFENYLWGNGTAFEPQFSKCRKVIAKLISVMNVIDDFYDTYGTLEEAQLFTTAIKRWDLKAMEDLPNFLKLCYLALYNFVNETAYDILKDFGWDVRRILTRECLYVCEAYLKEAEWFHKRITPSLEEYLENGWTTIGCRGLMIYAFYYVGADLTKELLDHLERAYKLIRLSSLIVRLIDDLVPSKAEMENGETSLAIHCHMRDTSKSYEKSKEFIEDLIHRYCKELTKETLNRNLPRNFIYTAINTPRTCFTMFQQEDGIGTGTGLVKDHIKSLFIEPIPM